MNPVDIKALFPIVGNNSGLAESETFYREELQLAARNRGMPLEVLRYPITPASLHYLLVHYDVPEVNATDWALKIGGRVAHPLTLTLDNIRQRPAQTMAVTMECAGNGRALFQPRRISQPWLHEAIGTAEWTGTSLHGLLEATGLYPDAVEMVFTGLDRGVEGGQVQSYQRSLTVSEAKRDEVLLAYAMNGEPLPPQHGYPLRLIVPGWYGMTSVKWLDHIEAVAEPFEGYQMAQAYRYAATVEDPSDPVNLIRVRALMVPPGIPDFLTRTRLLEAGRVTLKGRAWAGRLSVSQVEVSTDGGFTWTAAHLDAPLSPYAWRGWSFPWDATPGEYSLCVRAADSEGNLQPSDPEWNTGGYGNNAFQRVHVIVKPTLEEL